MSGTKTKPHSGPLAHLLNDLRSNAVVRAKFSEEPIAVLEEYGIHLSPEAAKEVRQQIKEIMRNLDTLLNIESIP